MLYQNYSTHVAVKPPLSLGNSQPDEEIQETYTDNNGTRPLPDVKHGDIYIKVYGRKERMFTDQRGQFLVQLSQGY